MAERFISSSTFPDPPKGKVANFKNLAGGLNLWELDYRMDADQSPDMKNLWWRDGLLGCRDGQEYVSDRCLGKGHCCFEGLYHGYMVAHIGDGIYGAIPGSEMTLTKLCDGVPEVRGTFFRYQDDLLYKTTGAFKKICWDGKTLSAEDVTPYVPVTVINCTPEGSGDLYQPENRLSAQKTVWYTAAVETRGAMFTVYTNTKVFAIEPEEGETVAAIEQVYLGTTLLDETRYTVSEDLLTITLSQNATPGETVSVVYAVGVREYHLPVAQVESIDKVVVDDEEVSDYTADLEAGVITFTAAPAVQDPPVNNTVKITYTKKNEAAYDALMDCRYATTYGGSGGAVIVLAGSREQPNAYFWNGSHVAMDAGYFPVSYYNLAGDTPEPVTGFGQQAGYLMVFKEHAVGRCLLATATIDDRAYLSLDYTSVNPVMGCDLPWTIRMVENNLVWCNTYAGVCRLETTTPALENQVVPISRNILGCDARPGLLRAVRDAETVCALDDGDRYWVVAQGEAFLWDYTISSAANPSWFYFTNIPAVDFFRADTVPTAADDGLSYTGARRIYHLDAQGRISRFVRTFRDYGGAIEKVYQFATQNFGDYERQKHIRKLILTTRSDTDTVIELDYATDHGTRRDPTPIRSYSWRLLPRNLAFRYLGVRRFAHVAVRLPGCRYVRNFSLRLSNHEPGCDMSIVSAQVYADLVVKER